MRNNYYCVWKCFNKFFLKLDSKPDEWEDRLTLFVGYLVESRHKSSTIRSYISTIKAILYDAGVQLSEDRYLLSSLIRACKLNNDVIQTKIPIQHSLFHLILNNCNLYFINRGQVYLAILYKAIFTAAYYGMLRIGEVTTGDHPIKAVDVHIAENKRKFLFLLRSSKTHTKGDKPQIIKISVGKGEMDANCPFDILQDFVLIRLKCKSPVTEPFFVFTDCSPVQPRHVRSILQSTLKDIGLNERLYSFHCFRSGRSTDLYERGISVSMIMKLGRWKSNSVYTYLR